MVIKTKYEIGTELYFIEEDELHLGQVVKIIAVMTYSRKSDMNKLRIKYKLHDLLYEGTYIEKLQKEVFLSKEFFLKSIKSSYSKKLKNIEKQLKKFGKN